LDEKNSKLQIPLKSTQMSYATRATGVPTRLHTSHPATRPFKETFLNPTIKSRLALDESESQKAALKAPYALNVNAADRINV
jgi:hypothetical protein